MKLPLRLLVCTTLLAVLLLSACESGRAQFVTVALRHPMPNQLTPSDLWEFTLQNAARPLPSVVITATVQQSGGGVVATMRSQPISLPIGTRLVTSRNIGNLGPLTAQYSPQVRDAVDRTGSFPSGEYTVCVQVIASSATNGGELASDCIEQRVEQSQQVLLLSPADGSSLNMKYPVFTWTPLQVIPSGAVASRVGAGLRYLVSIVEVIGKQSPEAALQGNPRLFEKDGLTAGVLAYPPAAREFQDGHTYAWGVSAFAGSTLLGKSEVWTFRYESLQPYARHDSVRVLPHAERVINVRDELFRSCAEEGNE